MCYKAGKVDGFTITRKGRRAILQVAMAKEVKGEGQEQRERLPHCLKGNPRLQQQIHDLCPSTPFNRRTATAGDPGPLSSLQASFSQQQSTSASNQQVAWI